MYAVRRSFVKAESCDKIKRALRHPVRASEEFFKNGEKVFYKRDDGKRWHGPGKVVGQLGTVVFVIHGSRLIRCTSCRVIKAPLSNASNENSDQTSTDKHVSADKSNLKEDISEDSELDISIESDIDDTECSEELDTNRKEISTDAIAPRENAEEKFTVRKSSRTRSPPSRLGWQTKEAFAVIIPKERHNDPDVVEAKKAELGNWIDLEAVDWVEDKGQKLISTRWVITENEYPDGEAKPKARLVIRGFEENEDIQADASTASKTALRIVLALAANYDWSISTADVKAAFLQERPINRDIYINPPRELSTEGKIWRLHRTAYGLVDFARN